MLAMIAEFRLVEMILRDLNSQTNKDLAQALAKAGFLADGKPAVAAVRVTMESEYRDFWELPSDDAIKTKIALWLVQDRKRVVAGKSVYVRADHGCCSIIKKKKK